MNTIARTPLAGTNAPAGTPADVPASGNDQVSTSGTSGLNLPALLELLKQAGSGSSGSGDSAGSDSNAPPGAPALQQPDLDFSPEAMALEIQSLMDKTNDLQNKAEAQNIKVTQQRQDDAHAKNIAAIDKAAKKIEAAKKKQKALGILGIIGKVFAVVAAAVMTVVSAGALAAVAGVICAYAITDLAMSVASTVNQSKGGKDISLETLTTEGLATALEKTGHSEKDADKMAGYLSLGLQCAIALATLVVGVGGATGLIGGATSAATSAATETTAEASSQALTQALTQATSEAAADATAETASEAAADATAETASEAVADATAETASEVAADAAAEAASEAAIQALAQTASQAATEATSETAVQATSQATSQTASQATSQTTSQTTSQATSQATSKTAGETSVSGPDDDAEGSSKVAEAAANTRRGAKLTQLTSQVMNGLNTAAGGVLTISKGYDDRDAADAQADQIRFQGMLAALQALVDASIDRVKDLAQQASSDTQSTTDMIKTAHDSKMATAAPAATV